MGRTWLAFLGSFAVVATSGVVLVVWARAKGGFGGPDDPDVWTPVGLAPFVLCAEVIVAAVVTARHHRVRDWLAAYVGVVLGAVPALALMAVFWSASWPDVIWQAGWLSLVLVAWSAGLVFIVAGGLTYLATREV